MIMMAFLLTQVTHLITKAADRSELYSSLFTIFFTHSAFLQSLLLSWQQRILLKTWFGQTEMRITIIYMNTFRNMEFTTV
jgi:hypothetical protein